MECRVELPPPRAEPREARLRIEFATLYPGFPPGNWLSARELNDMVVAARLRAAGRAGATLRGRMLDARHFEFRGGTARQSARQTRVTDQQDRQLPESLWAAGASPDSPVRQVLLRHEYAAWYPMIPPGLWLPAHAVAGILGRPRPSPYGFQVPRRPLDPAHFGFRAGSTGAGPRRSHTRATDGWGR
jgi:hypothetical protein